MASTLTIENSINNMQNFLDDIQASFSSYYYFVGKTTPWPDDTNPPIANTSYFETASVYRDLVYGKKITSLNVTPLINYYPWIANTVYSQYDNKDPNLFTSNFYVVTSTYSVYKCIDNNNGARSTVQPTIKPTVGVFETSDGYTWKFMFSIDSSSNTKFSTSYYVPVINNTAIVTNAIPGSIDVVRLPQKGYNYKCYNTGIINYLVSGTSIQLGNTASSTDNFYVGCSIYLKTGLGAGQLTNITNYAGATKTAIVNPPFNVMVNLELSGVTGNFLIDDIVKQSIYKMGYLYNQGFSSIGDQLIQSDTGVSAYVSSVNTSIVQLVNASNTIFTGANSYPLYDVMNSGVLQTATATIVTGSNSVTMSNTSGYSNNQFIRVGNTVSNNIRRITNIVNSTVVTVSYPFVRSLTSNVVYVMPTAYEPATLSQSQANGVIVNRNINSVLINYSNTSIVGGEYRIGEVVKEYNNSLIDASSNGIVSFCNATTMILTSISGTFITGYKLIGQSSNLVSNITNFKTYPNITLGNIQGSFQNGVQLNAYIANGAVDGNAAVISSTFMPGGQIEYIVSPKVNFSGDGNSATAYAIVNTASNSIFEISDIVMLNTGSGYTFANASITAPSGLGANLYPVVSPINGHGSNPVSELGARNAGISVTFNSPINESYKFPSYGSYRRIGILKNPLYSDVYLGISSPLRFNMFFSNNSGNFTKNEIVFQPATNAAGVIVASNTTWMQISNTNNSFANTGNTYIQGLTSTTTALVTEVDPISFNVTANAAPQSTAYNQGILTQVVNSSLVRLSDVPGNLANGFVIFDATVNAYAKVLTMGLSNNTVNVTGTFGSNFTQTSRIALASNSIPFQVGERIAQQLTSSDGLVFNIGNEVDLTYTPISGSISVGTILSDTNSGANGSVIYANSTYIKLTAVSGKFNGGDLISCVGANGTVANAYPVLMVTDITTPFQVGATNPIVGNTSGAVGYSLLPNSITYPDLIRGTGEIIYINDVPPFTVNSTSSASFFTVISF